MQTVTAIMKTSSPDFSPRISVRVLVVVCLLMLMFEWKLLIKICHLQSSVTNVYGERVFCYFVEFFSDLFDYRLCDSVTCNVTPTLLCGGVGVNVNLGKEVNVNHQLSSGRF